MLVLESETEANSVQDVIERLRLSKQTKAQEIVNEGRESGIQWAKLHAEYDELRRMAQVAAWGSENHKGAEEVFKEVTGRELQIPDDMADFYLIDHPVVMETATYEFVTGFIEGARDVWYAVDPKLCPLAAQEQGYTPVVQLSDEEVATA
jgi:hypothetical protein